MRRLLAGAVLAAPLVGAFGGRRAGPLLRRDQAHRGGMRHIKARDYGSLGFGYAGTDGLGPPGLTLDSLGEMLFSNRHFIGELLTEREIRSDPEYARTRVSGRR